MKGRIGNALLLALMLFIIVSGFVSRCDNPSTRPFGSYRSGLP